MSSFTSFEELISLIGNMAHILGSLMIVAAAALLYIRIRGFATLMILCSVTCTEFLSILLFALPPLIFHLAPSILDPSDYYPSPMFHFGRMANTLFYLWMAGSLLFGAFRAGSYFSKMLSAQAYSDEEDY